MDGILIHQPYCTHSPYPERGLGLFGSPSSLRTGGTKKEVMIMKFTLALLLGAALSFVTAGFAQVAHDVATAGKHTGHGTEKVGKGTTHVAHGTGHDVAKGTKDVGHGVKKVTAKTIHVLK
jgi:hypothetical protein